MKHDAIYARYSSHAQDDGTSIEVQLEQCERAAGGPCKHYIDRARTGRSVGGRLELERLMNDAAAGKVKRLFAYRYDRLGRSGAVHAIMEDLEDYGVEVISVTEGQDSLARGVSLVVAQDFSKKQGQRIKDGLVKRFGQGAWTGGRSPFGYVPTKRDDGGSVLTVDAQQAAVLREMAGWYANEAVGFLTLARRLNTRGVAGPSGMPWTSSTVRRALVNPILIGRPKYNRRKAKLVRATGRHRLLPRPTEEHIERHDESLRILDDNLFARVHEQASRASKRAGARRGRSIAAFTGLLTCAGCGNRLYRVQRGSAGTVMYVCKRHRDHRDCPAPARVREDRLVTLLQKDVADVLAHADRIASAVVKAATASVRESRDRSRELARELAQVDQEQRKWMVELAKADDDAKAPIYRQLATTEARRAQLEQALSESRAGSADRAEAEVTALLEQVLATARENLSAVGTPERFNRLVEQMVGSMVIDRHGRVKRRTDTERPEGVAVSADSTEVLPQGRSVYRSALWHTSERVIQAMVWKRLLAA